jgi:hypothetical protein
LTICSGTREGGGAGTLEREDWALRNAHNTTKKNAIKSKYFMMAQPFCRATKHSRSALQQGCPTDPAANKKQLGEPKRTKSEPPRHQGTKFHQESHGVNLLLPVILAGSALDLPRSRLSITLAQVCCAAHAPRSLSVKPAVRLFLLTDCPHISA